MMQNRDEQAGMPRSAGNRPYPDMPGAMVQDMPWTGQPQDGMPQQDMAQQPYMGELGPIQADQSRQSGGQPQQAVVSARVVEQADCGKRAERFHAFGLGCFLYALFYTCCLYHNASGITYPFFAGGTLWFFISYIKRSGSSSAGGRQQIDNRFLMAAILIAGALNCATDSGVLLFFNKLLMFSLLGLLLLQCWHDTVSWSVSSYVKGFIFQLFGGIDQMLLPIGDWRAFCRVRKMSGKKEEEVMERRRIGKAVGVGLLIALPMSMCVLLLLASADEVFSSLLLDMLEFPFYLDIGKGIAIALEVLAVTALSYGIFAYNTDPHNKETIDGMAASPRAAWDPYIAVTVNIVMCAIYVVFSGIQVFSLFLGNLPKGYTYSAYARRGFFELMSVCVFNVILVLCTLAYFEKTKAIKVLLTVICGCTYIMIISSAFRMLLYIESYQLTFLRITVLWVLLMTSVIMAGVLWYIYHHFPLFRFMVMTLTVGWLAFSALHPDLWIAFYNSNMDEEFDKDYLMDSLSLDAVPALGEEICSDISGDHYWEAKEYQERISEFMGVRKFNFSRAYAARKILGDK